MQTMWKETKSHNRIDTPPGWRRLIDSEWRITLVVELSGLRESIICWGRETDPDDISCVLFARIFDSPLWSREIRLFSLPNSHVQSPAVVLDFIFCWMILWSLARSSKPSLRLRLCNWLEHGSGSFLITEENFLSWGIVRFNIMWFFHCTAIKSQISNWIENNWVQQCSIQIPNCALNLNSE